MEQTQGYPYSFLITNARAYLRDNPPLENTNSLDNGGINDNGGITAFRISELLGILLCKRKEDVLVDLLDLNSPKP